jgi:hypothetical protein
MPRTNFLPFIILAVLTAPLVHLMSLKNSPAADPGYGLTYYSIFLSGPALLVYGFVTYQHEQHRTLTWITFVQGDV